MLISEGEEPDKVHIHLAKDLFLSRNIYDDVDDQNAPPSRLLSTIETRDELIFTVDLPKLLPNLQEGEELESQGDSANSAMKGNFLTSFITQFFLNGSLSLLWNIFNTLQLIIGLEYLSVIMPSNVALIYKTIKDVVNF